MYAKDPRIAIAPMLRICDPWPVACRLARMLIALVLVMAAVASPALQAAPAPILLLTIDGAIGPANADYVVRGIARAAKDGHQLVIIKMDTPGGLDPSMRSIIKAILSSPVPVASFVGPGGARAASAGTYILYASHIAAMAPGTNLGAATPVQLGGPQQPDAAPPSRKDAPPRGRTEEAPEAGKARNANPADEVTSSPSTRKQVNDASAYIRGLAQMRGRNVEWAERAVREAVSLPANEALKMRVIEYVAVDIETLATQLDGKKVTVLGQEKQLQTKGAPVIDARPDWRADALSALTNPSVALLLMTIGMYGLIFEFMNPGFGVPGVIGAICLLLGLYALQMLPVNYAGLALILLGIAFMLAEAFVPSFGILGLGGVAAFVAGGLILIDTDIPGFGIPIGLLVAVAVVSGILIVAIATIALQTRRRPVHAGPGSMVGNIAEMADDASGAGWAYIHGERWHVVSDVPLQRAQKVRVVARDGLVLKVAPLNKGD